MKHRLHKHVAALLSHHCRILTVYRLNKLIGFFYEIYPYAFVRLSSVPLASVLGSQSAHNLYKIRKVKSPAFRDRAALYNYALGRVIRIKLFHGFQVCSITRNTRDFYVAVAVRQSVAYGGNILF